jgi:hypothetical protein
MFPPLGIAAPFLGQAEPSHSLLAAFLSFFIHPIVTWTLASGIVLFGVGVWAWFRFHLMREASISLARAKGTLNRIATAGDFTNQSAALNRELRANPLLGSEWKAFYDHLVPAGGETPLRRTREAGYYFNENLLYRAGINLRFYNAFSGYLLGIGLLCTFFGLVAALYVASLAMDSSPEKLVAILQNLLAAASFKFINSIAGLGTSMLFSWQVRDEVHRFQAQIDDFCAKVDDIVPCVSAESLLADGAEGGRLQTLALQRLPEALSSVLDKRLSESLLKLVDPISEKIEGMTQRITHLSQEAVAAMVKEFRQQLAGAATEELAALVKGIEASREAIEKTNQQLFSQMADGAGRMEESFRNTAKQLESSLQPLASQVLGLNESFLRMDEKMKHHLDLFTEAMGGLRGVLADFRGTAERLGEASAPLTVASQDLFAMSKRFQESNEATVQALKQLSSFSQSLSDTSQQTRATWDAYRERFEKVDDDLKGMVDQLGNGFTRYHDMVEGFVRQLDTSLAKSTEALGASIVELNGTMDRLEARK